MKHIAKLVLMIAAMALAELGVATADAGPITWHWTGTVTGHTPPAGVRLDSVVPLGTPIDVMLSFDPEAAPLNPATCLHGMASTSLQVLGRTYTSAGYVWEDAMGFGPGVCAPGSNRVEVVVPSWGGVGPALPGGFVPFGDFSYLPGLWWEGDLTRIQPLRIGAQFPLFNISTLASPQRFFASLQAVPDLDPDLNPTPVPEPASMTLFGLGLAAVGARRWRARRASVS